MYNKGHSRFEGVEIKGDLKPQVEMLGHEGPVRIGIELSKQLETLSEERNLSAPSRKFRADNNVELTKGIHLENKWIPKWIDDSFGNDQISSDSSGQSAIMAATEAMAEDLDLLDSVGDENQRKLVSHLRRERSAGLRNKKIKSVIAEKHELKCEVCDFNFEIAYGQLGKGFAEVHHIKPLSTLGETKTKLSDLAVLCSNCHRMIHRTNPIENLETFRARIQAVHLEEA